jgi:CHAD domain-containing protein
MRTWHIVRLQSKVLSPAAEAFRYFVVERAEPFLRAEMGDLEDGLVTPASPRAGS